MFSVVCYGTTIITTEDRGLHFVCVYNVARSTTTENVDPKGRCQKPDGVDEGYAGELLTLS